MAVFNVSCFNPALRKPDPETGCILGCGTRVEYESCRQSFYLKQQNEILVNSQKKVEEGVKEGGGLEPILSDKENQQTAQLVRSSEGNLSKIEDLSVVNTFLLIVLVFVVCTFFIVKFIKKTRTTE